MALEQSKKAGETCNYMATFHECRAVSRLRLGRVSSGGGGEWPERTE